MAKKLFELKVDGCANATWHKDSMLFGCLLLGKEDPTMNFWEGFVRGCGQSLDYFIKNGLWHYVSLSVSDGGMPNSKHRNMSGEENEKYNGVLKDRKMRNIVICESKLVRGSVTAVHWLTGRPLKSGLPQKTLELLDWAEIKPEHYPWVQKVLMAAQKEVPEVHLLHAVLQQLRQAA